MMEISPALANVPAAYAATDVAQPLPGMVMGDAAVAARHRHGVRGWLFVAFSYLMAAGSASSAIMFALADGGGHGDAGRALSAGVWAVLQCRLAGEVQRFSRWGWYGAMAELSFAAATKLVWVFHLRELAFLFACLLAVDALLLRYFWTRRAQFDVAIGG